MSPKAKVEEAPEATVEEATPAAVSAAKAGVSLAPVEDAAPEVVEHGGLTPEEVAEVNAASDHTYAEDGQDGRPLAKAAVTTEDGRPVDIGALIDEQRAAAEE